MMKGKQARLLDSLGKHMQESAGGLAVEDRYEGFVPSPTSLGEMALDRIEEDPDQPRKTFDDVALNELAANLKAHGVQQPIQLRWSSDRGKWLIVYGHRRFRAARIAGLATIPCTFTNETIDEATLRVRQLVENCQREDLAPMEMARGLKSLAELTGWSNRRIAEELGISHSSVGRTLALLELPTDVQELVASRELAPSVAKELTKAGDPRQQSHMAREIVEHGLNRQQAKARLGQKANPTDSAGQVKPSGHEKQLLVNTINVAVYRNPDASDLKIRNELLAIVEQLDVEKAES